MNAIFAFSPLENICIENIAGYVTTNWMDIIVLTIVLIHLAFLEWFIDVKPCVMWWISWLPYLLSLTSYSSSINLLRFLLFYQIYPKWCCWNLCLMLLREEMLCVNKKKSTLIPCQKQQINLLSQSPKWNRSIADRFRFFSFIFFLFSYRRMTPADD